MEKSHKRLTKREEQEQKRILELKLQVLKKKNPKAQQFYEREVLHHNDKSIYEKYRTLYEKQQHEVDEEKLVQEEVFDSNKSKSDSFFLDPEEDKQVLEMAQKQVEMKIQQEPERNLNASKFLPFQNLTIRGNNGEVVNLQLHSSKFGSKVQTPSLKLQQILDPSNFQFNPNFLPIPEEKNKIMQKMQEKMKNIESNDEEQANEKKRKFSTLQSIFGGEDDENEEENESEEEEETEVVDEKDSKSKPNKQNAQKSKELPPKKKKTRRAGKRMRQKKQRKGPFG